MAASDELKERIEQYFNGTNVPNSQKDWKRVQKFTLNGETVREFYNQKLNRSVYTTGDDEDGGIYERDQWVYGIHTNANFNPNDPFEPEFSLCFEPSDRFSRTGYIYDQHQQHLLETFHFLPAEVADEAMENSFVVEDGLSVLKIHILLAKHGFKHSQALTDFINDPGNGPAPQPPTPPVGPPLPPAMDPNWTPPVQASKAPPAPGALAAAAAATSSPVNLMAALGAALGQQGTNVIGVGPGGTMTPLNPIHLPKLPPSGLFNAPGMQAAMPLMAGQWPELINLQPAVQAAFISQRAAGLQGLDQVNQAWDDGHKLARSINSGTFTSIERSHAIWMLFEEADDGSGDALYDYFASDNEDLMENLIEVFDFDEDEFEIIDDQGQYPSPFDIPAPIPAPPAPPPQQQRPLPRVGPSGGVITGSGSFAPPPQAPAAVAPPAPPPGNAAAHMRNDSGDKWPEFCGEVWDTYEANKANLPLDLDWYDRYRPREAQITGLGFQMDRVEFTGIRVLMGYLDRDGKLLDTIDIPSKVFDELLSDWGGDWNVDDITQFISKRKGEDPETGFSYSSQTLFDEVKPYLISKGWKEV